MIRQTSITSYQNLSSLGERYKLIVDLLTLCPDSTDSELTRLSGHSDPNYIRPRRNELVKKGYVVDNGSRICQITGKKATTWRLC